jgi:hypothetical protein
LREKSYGTKYLKLIDEENKALKDNILLLSQQ